MCSVALGRLYQSYVPVRTIESKLRKRYLLKSASGGEAMEIENNEVQVKRSLFTKLTGNLSIRNKLLIAFMIMILLTLAVSAVTIVSNQQSQKTIDNLVQIQSKVARLSFQTENSLRIMHEYEKDFLLNYQKIGIQEAKTKYMLPFTEKGGETYQTLYEIEQIVAEADTGSFQSAQKAMDAINEYLSSFIGTVNILELRYDKEFGELVKLDEALNALNEEIEELDDRIIEDNFGEIKEVFNDYLINSSVENGNVVQEQLKELPDVIGLSTLPLEERNKLLGLTKEFDNWFKQVAATDIEIAARIAEYKETAQKAEPIIASFIARAVQGEKKATETMQASADLTKNIAFGVGGVAVLLGLLLAFILSKSLTEQVNHIVDLLGEIGMGNFDARTPVVTQDELGTMADALNAMLDNITILIQSQAERDQIQGSIMTLLQEISALTEGDLRGRAEVKEDLTGAIADSFNAMAEQFTDIITKVKTATQSVDNTSEEVSSKTMGLATKNVEQSTQVEKAIATIDIMANSIKDVAVNAQKTAEVSEQSRMNAKEGAEAVQKTNAAMNEIREEINETARSIKRLGESSLEIGNVVQIIDDLSDRTSILALNASIQAAMAGDAGHGFAVVADEVQRLAESSSNSTKQIESLVNNIQAEIKNVSSRMDESISKVVQGSQLADGAHEKLQQIEDTADNMSSLIESITASTTEQVEVSEQITATMHNVGDVSKESSLSSQETAESMDELRKTARELRDAVETFRIEDEEEITE